MTKSTTDPFNPSTIELQCGCCFGHYSLEDMTECSADASHNVCQECVRRYVMEQLDGNNSAKFKCIVDSECSCTYPDSVLDQVLSPCLKRRVDDLVFREEIKMAGLDHWHCPKCAYLGTIDETLPTVLCPECDVYYCVDCNQVEHGIKTCEEARREGSLRDPVRRAHEAMTQAVKRHCPSCNREFMKSDGCNKMTCHCGTKNCYLCSREVRGYSHFCDCDSRRNCWCGKECKLFTSTQDMELLDDQIGWSAGETVLQEAGMSPKEIERNLGPRPAGRRRRRRRRRDPEEAAVRVARNPDEHVANLQQFFGRQVNEQRAQAREQQRAQAREQQRAQAEQHRQRMTQMEEDLFALVQEQEQRAEAVLQRAQAQEQRAHAQQQRAWAHAFGFNQHAQRAQAVEQRAQAQAQRARQEPSL